MDAKGGGVQEGDNLCPSSESKIDLLKCFMCISAYNNNIVVGNLLYWDQGCLRRKVVKRGSERKEQIVERGREKLGEEKCGSCTHTCI